LAPKLYERPNPVSNGTAGPRRRRRAPGPGGC